MQTFFKRLFTGGPEKSRTVAIWFFTLAALAILVIFVPTVFIHVKTDKAEIRKKINSYLADSKLNVTYDDFDLSFYRGLILYQFEISIDSEQTRKILTATTLNVQISWSEYLSSQELKIEKIYSPDSTWYLRFTDDGLESLQALNQWISQQGSFEMNFAQASFHLDLRAGNYKKALYLLKKSQASLKRTGEKLEFTFDHESKKWGQARVRFASAGCEKTEQCNWFLGLFRFSVEEFPAARLSWLSDHYKLTGGNLTGDFFLQNNPKEKFLSVFARGRELNLAAEDEELFTALNNDVEAFILFKKRETRLQMRGTYFSMPFFAALEKSSRDVWPELLIIEAGEPEKPLPLPGSYEVNGLKKLYLKLTEPRRGSYRNLDAELVLKNATLRQNNEDILRFLNVKMKMLENEYTMNMGLQYRSSDISAKLKGTVETKKDSFSPVLDRYDQSYRNDERIKIVRFKLNSRGDIQSRQMHFKDILHLVKKGHLFYKERLKQGQQLQFIKPRLMQRRWYKRYVQQNYFDADVKIDSFEWPDQRFKNIGGTLSLGYPRLELVLEHETEDDKNFLNFTWSYPGNQPYVDLEYDISLLRPAKILKHWLPPSLINQAESARFIYQARSRGERMADLHKYRRIYEYITLENASFSKKIKRYSGLPWPVIKIRIKQDHNKGSVKVAARREKERIEFAGRIEEKNFEPVFIYEKIN